jgi:hypothetical protein
MILQATAGQPAKQIAVPSHRTKPIMVGEAIYTGILTGTRERKVVHSFAGTSPAPRETEVVLDTLPSGAQNFLRTEFSRLEKLYFPTR